MKLRKPEDLDPLEQLVLIDMSFSRLDEYSMCAAKYFYDYIIKEPKVFGPAASLGSILHSCLEDTVGEPLDLDHMISLMDVHREAHDPEGKIDDELWGVGKLILTEFYDNHEGETFNIIGKELPFELIIGSAKVRGFIDLVTEDAAGVRVTDYKSGKYEIAAKNVHESLQLGIYALAMSQDYPDQPIHAEMYYLRSGRRKGHTFTPAEMEEVYDRVLHQVNTMINDRHFKVTPDPRPCMMFCDFARTGACATGAMRLRNKKW